MTRGGFAAAFGLRLTACVAVRRLLNILRLLQEFVGLLGLVTFIKTVDNAFRVLSRNRNLGEWSMRLATAALAHGSYVVLPHTNAGSIAWCNGTTSVLRWCDCCNAGILRVPCAKYACSVHVRL